MATVKEHIAYYEAQARRGRADSSAFLHLTRLARPRSLPIDSVPALV